MRAGRTAPILLGFLTVGAVAHSAEPKWDFSVAAFTYFVPEDSDYVQPTVTADREWLHLEARFQYEDRDTGSVWVGYNLSAGERVSFEFTPMLGAVFGHTTGIAPGYRVSLGWRWLELYSEGEYVFDTGDRDDSYFYAWSEWTVSPVDWFRAGLVGQRTRVYERPREIQRGILVGFRVKSAEVTAHVFNPDDGKPRYVLSVSVEF